MPWNRTLFSTWKLVILACLPCSSIKILKNGRMAGGLEIFSRSCLSHQMWLDFVAHEVILCRTSLPPFAQGYPSLLPQSAVAQLQLYPEGFSKAFYARLPPTALLFLAWQLASDTHYCPHQIHFSLCSPSAMSDWAGLLSLLSRGGSWFSGADNEVGWAPERLVDDACEFHHALPLHPLLPAHGPSSAPPARLNICPRLSSSARLWTSCSGRWRALLSAVHTSPRGSGRNLEACNGYLSRDIHTHTHTHTHTLFE